MADKVHLFICPKCGEIVDVFVGSCSVTCKCGHRMTKTATVSRDAYRKVLAERRRTVEKGRK